MSERCGLANCYGEAVASMTIKRPAADGSPTAESQTVRICDYHHELIGGKEVGHFSMGFTTPTPQEATDD